MSTFQSFEIDRDRDPHSFRKMMLIRPEPDPLHANLGKFGMCRNLYPGVPPISMFFYNDGSGFVCDKVGPATPAY